MANIPTAEQGAVMACSSMVRLVDAVAGSGKTTTLAMVAREWAERSRSNARIVCLAFTESAKRRFKQKLLNEASPESIVPTTVVEYAHSGLNALMRAGFLDRPPILRSALDIRGRIVDAAEATWQKYEQRGNTDFDFAFENNTERVDQLLKLLRRLKATLMTHQFDTDDFYSHGIYEIAEALDVPVEAIEICAAHERMRHRMPGEYEWQTEDDLVPDLVKILESTPLALTSIPKASLYLIDEWHDVNASEFELIRLLRRQSTLVAVADRDQVIDGARGAELKFSTGEFFRVYPEAIRFPLSKSRRFGASLSREAGSLTSRRLESIEGLHTTIYRVSYDPTLTSSCASVVAKHVASLHEGSHKIKFSDIAIIVREEDQSIEIENMLIDMGIPYQCEGIASYLMRPEILMLRALLHLVSGNFEALREDAGVTREMVGALAMFVSMSSKPKNWAHDGYEASRKNDDPLEIAKDTIVKEPSALSSFFSGVLCRPHAHDRDSTRRWKTRFDSALDVIKEEAVSSSAAELLERANSLIDLSAAANRALLQRSQADSAIRSIRSFIAFAKKFPKCDAGMFLDELQQRQRKLQSTTNGHRRRAQVKLVTVRSAKGQEWPHVILPYLQMGEFPRGPNLQEEKRFLYVAMTRAQESLTLVEPGEAFRAVRSSLIHGPKAREKLG